MLARVSDPLGDFIDRGLRIDSETRSSQEGLVTGFVQVTLGPQERVYIREPLRDLARILNIGSHPKSLPWMREKRSDCGRLQSEYEESAATRREQTHETA